MVEQRDASARLWLWLVGGVVVVAGVSLVLVGVVDDNGNAADWAGAVFTGLAFGATAVGLWRAEAHIRAERQERLDADAKRSNLERADAEARQGRIAAAVLAQVGSDGMPGQGSDGAHVFTLRALEVRSDLGLISDVHLVARPAANMSAMRDADGNDVAETRVSVAPIIYTLHGEPIRRKQIGLAVAPEAGASVKRPLMFLQWVDDLGRTWEAPVADENGDGRGTAQLVA